MMTLRSISRIGLALSDPTRLRLLAALRGGELCGCQLTELLDLAPSTVSKHLSLLREAGMVESRKRGRWVHYRLSPGASLPDLAARSPGTARAAGPASLQQMLGQCVEVQADDRKLRAIRRADLEVLCKQRRRR